MSADQDLADDVYVKQDYIFEKIMNPDKDMESFIQFCESKKPGCNGNLNNITINELKDIVAEFLGESEVILNATDTLDNQQTTAEAVNSETA